MISITSEWDGSPMPGGIFLFIEEGMCRSAFAAKIRFSFLSSDVSVFRI